jgi:hypothetical protein
MLRVVLGRARPDTEWSGKVSGLRFGSAPGVQESARSRGATSTIATVLRSHHGEEADLEEANGDSKPTTERLELAEELGRTEEEKATAEYA